MYDFELMRQYLHQHNPKAAAFHAEQMRLLIENIENVDFPNMVKRVVSDSMTLYIPVAPTSAVSSLISNLKKSKTNARQKWKWQQKQQQQQQQQQQQFANECEPAQQT